MTLPDLTARDRAAIFARSIKTIRTVYPDWSDEKLASFQNIILSSLADIGDTNNWYIDDSDRQARLATTTLRPIALIHADSLGYNVSGTSAAVTDMLVTLNAVPTSRIDIAPGDILFSTSSTTPVEFNISQAVELPTGQDPPQFLVPVENAESITDIFVSNNEDKQEFTLRQGPYIQGSAVVSAGGESYEIKTSLIKSSGDDAHVEGTLVDDDRLRLTFGDNSTGKVPTGQITVTYKFGGGRVGLVEATTINTFTPASIKDVDGNTYNIVSVTNLEKAQEGEDRESLGKIKEKAPRSRQTAANRTIAFIDYINHTEEVNGVARAFLVTHRNAALSPNDIRIIVLPTGGGLPSQTLKDRVLQTVTVDKPNDPLHDASVQDPQYLTVDITASVYLTEGSEEAAVRTAVEAVYEAFFEPLNDDDTVNTQILFGSEYVDNGQIAEIPYHQLLAEMQNIDVIHAVGESASSFLVNNKHENVDIGTFQFPQLGTILLFNAATGDAF